ncbi:MULTISPECIES: hypothetical protein [unclassified Caballeronia]|uniref:hypothetical protein n=1 Tax=unclassified Caballeronia TaxID=2646786 RepID=UPI001F19A00A|nr:MULTISPECIES: hypothetical protein [unclassified Caballeronia]MCE4547409.1 hypothetical protein [Caballeronia sp. PC1]MCE4575393.1 hypothetical protein [Caballeronia sp. CLC5]
MTFRGLNSRRWPYAIGVVSLLGISSSVAQCETQNNGSRELAARLSPTASVPAQMLMYRKRDLYVDPTTGRERPVISMPKQTSASQALQERLVLERQSFESDTGYWKGVEERASIAELGATAISMTGWGSLPGTIGNVGFAAVGNAAKSATDAAVMKHRSNIKDIYRSYGAQLRAKRPKEYRDTLAMLWRNNESDRREALRSIAGGIADMFDQRPPHSLSESELIAATPDFIDALREGLVNTRLLSKEEIRELGDRVSAGEAALAKTGEAVSYWRRAAANQRKEGEYLHAEVSSMKTSLQTTNGLLFSRMSASEQSQALKSGMDLGLSEKQRNELLRKIEPIVDEENRKASIYARQETVGNVVTIATTTFGLIRAVGGEVPPHVEKAVKIGQGLFNVATGFALNPMSGITALGGALSLFGQPGAQASDPALRQEMSELRKGMEEIKRVQLEQLTRLRQIDERLIKQHREVMSELEKINARLITLIAFAIRPVEDRLEACRSVTRKLTDLASDSASDSFTYDVFKTAFDENPELRSDFGRCNSVLHTLSSLSQQVPSPFLTRGRLNGTNDAVQQGTRTDTTFYRPAFDLMDRVNKSHSDWCDAHVRVLAAMPGTMEGIDDLLGTCISDGNYDPSHHLEMVSHGFAIHNYRETLSLYVHHDAPLYGPGADQVPLLELLRRYQSAIAPLYEAVDSNTQLSNVRLLPAKTLAKRKASPSALASERLARIYDLASLAAVQESMMAGIGLFSELSEAVDAAVRISVDGNGVTSSPVENLARPALAASDASVAEKDSANASIQAFDERCDIRIDSPIDAARLACLFERHPQMLMNTVVWKVRKALTSPSQKSATDAANFYLYGLAQQNGSLSVLNELTSESKHPIRWVEDSARAFGFVVRYDSTTFVPPGQARPAAGAYFKFKKLDNSLWYLPSPGRSDVERGVIRYRPTAYSLAATRAATEEEYLLYRVHLTTKRRAPVPPESRSTAAYMVEALTFSEKR